jgi:hypothetical protein
MEIRNRSLTGAAMAIFAMLVVLGLAACLPAPVGDPEKSTIDPYISGVWYFEGEDTFYAFEPYDKRTWLLTAIEVVDDPDFCDQDMGGSGTGERAAPRDYNATMARILALGIHCFEIERRPGASKAWRTRLGGIWFMTWEGKGVFDAETGFNPALWFVFSIEKSGPAQLKLWMIDEEHNAWDVLDDMEEENITRRVVEKIVRKHADEDDFYESDALVFHRVRPEHFELMEELFGD